MVDDVAAQAIEADESELHMISNLKPYTQYAIYVQTYTVAPQQTGKRVGARSPIIYERTRPDRTAIFILFQYTLILHLEKPSWLSKWNLD